MGWGVKGFFERAQSRIRAASAVAAGAPKRAHMKGHIRVRWTFDRSTRTPLSLSLRFRLIMPRIIPPGAEKSREFARFPELPPSFSAVRSDGACRGTDSQVALLRARHAARVTLHYPVLHIPYCLPIAYYIKLRGLIL